MLDTFLIFYVPTRRDEIIFGIRDYLNLRHLSLQTNAVVCACFSYKICRTVSLSLNSEDRYFKRPEGKNTIFPRFPHRCIQADSSIVPARATSRSHIFTLNFFFIPFPLSCIALLEMAFRLFVKLLFFERKCFSCDSIGTMIYTYTARTEITFLY